MLTIFLGNIVGGVLILPREARAVFGAGDVVFDPSVVDTIIAATDAEITAIAPGTTTTAGAAVSETTRSWADWANYILVTSINYAAYVAYVQLLSILSEKIIAWINGEDGSLQKLVDWRTTLDDVGDQAGGAFISSLAGINLCNFSPNFNLQLLLEVPNFKTNVTCTLSNIQDNISRLGDEISNGDWTNWIQLSQVPANNPYAVLLNSLEEKLNEENRRREAAKNEALAGGGFLSVKKCTDLSGKDVTSSIGDMTNAQISEAEYTCQTLTPSSLVNSIANKAALGQFDQLNNAASALTANLGVAGPFVIAIGNALINRVITFGFASALQAVNPGSAEETALNGVPSTFGQTAYDTGTSFDPNNPNYVGSSAACIADPSLPECVGAAAGQGLQLTYEQITAQTAALAQASINLPNYLAKINQLIGDPIGDANGVLVQATSKLLDIKSAIDASTLSTGFVDYATSCGAGGAFAGKAPCLVIQNLNTLDALRNYYGNEKLKVQEIQNSISFNPNYALSASDPFEVDPTKRGIFDRNSSGNVGDIAVPGDDTVFYDTDGDGTPTGNLAVIDESETSFVSNPVMKDGLLLAAKADFDRYNLKLTSGCYEDFTTISASTDFGALATCLAL